MPVASELHTVIVPVILDILLAIPGISHAYNYEPEMVEGIDIASLLQDAEGHVHFWSVQRESTAENYGTFEQCTLTHTMVLRGYKEVVLPAQDQPAFQALTSVLGDRFRNQFGIGHSPTQKILGPAQTAVAAQRRILADTWPVYYSELRFGASERVIVPLAD